MKKESNTVKEMFINSMRDESRVAIVKNNVLTELSVEQTSGSTTKGNIYKGKVVQIQESLHAAFIEYGEKRHGFLALDEVNFDVYPLQGNYTDKRTIKSRLKIGQLLLVQVTREPIDNKGAALSTFISLPGMYLVFSPQKGEGGISKKIQDDNERERLKSFISGISTENNSIVIRTAGIGKNLNELKKEYVSLKKEWDKIQGAYKAMEKPGRIFNEESNSVRMIRDYYTDDIENIWIDNPEIFQNIYGYFRKFLPAYINKLKLYMGEKTIFSNFGIEKQIENLSDSKIILPSGGSIVLQQTEALVSIDVNSGRSNQEGFSQKTALRTNLEAADEIARQLRLRNLAGLVVIDFIDMKTDGECKNVEDTLRKAMEDDKASHNIGNISQFGLLELSRQRLSQGYAATLEDKCPHCRGTGREPNQITYSNNILRKIKNIASEKKHSSITTIIPNEMAVYILNHKRRDIFDIETEFGLTVTINASNDLSNAEDIKFHSEKSAPAEKGWQSGLEEAHIVTEEPAVEQKQETTKRTAPSRSTKKPERQKPVHANTDEINTPTEKTPATPRITTPKAKENAEMEISTSCLMKNVPDIDPVKTGLMDLFYGNVGGRSKENTQIFIDSKYLMDIPNESAFFAERTVLPLVSENEDVETEDVETDDMPEIPDSVLDLSQTKSSTSEKVSSNSHRKNKTGSQSSKPKSDKPVKKTEKVKPVKQSAAKKSPVRSVQPSKSPAKNKTAAVKPEEKTKQTANRKKTQPERSSAVIFKLKKPSVRATVVKKSSGKKSEKTSGRIKTSLKKSR